MSDNLNRVTERLDEAALLEVDLIISTAGVSVGVFDYVRIALEKHGELDFWRVNMRPGKPLTVGSYRSVPFVGLPGNPVSAFVGFEVFLRPALYKLAGEVNWQREEQEARLVADTRSDGRESYLRGVLSRDESGYLVQPAAHQGSGNLNSLVKANALYILPAGVRKFPSGSAVKFWRI